MCGSVRPVWHNVASSLALSQAVDRAGQQVIGIRELQMSDAGFERAIFDHLALAERNRKLERTMPIDRYREMYEGWIGGSRPVSHDDLPAATPPLDPGQDFAWDASEERPAPRFDRKVA
jgi:hypothetical protein